MKLKVVVVDLELTHRQKRVATGSIALAVALAAGAALADVPKTFVAGETLRAADLNANFTALDNRLTAEETKAAPARAVGTIGAVSYSIGMTEYVGATDPYLGGELGGYTGVKALCEAVAASPSAHQCSVDEIWRLAQMGAAPPVSGWISGAAGSNWPMTLRDCFGWAGTGDAASDERGSVWDSTWGIVGNNYCWQGPTAALCCD